jgi:chemotaxis protein methyltransferase WspC
MSVAPLVGFLEERIGLTEEALGRSFPAVVERRIRCLRLNGVANYLALLRRQPEELQALIDEIIVPETWFFRGGELFDWLAGHIRQQVQACSRDRRQPFRVLSVPCSTGEEPLSLAIALAEQGSTPGGWSIDAVDLCARSLERARRGLYAGVSFRQTRPGLRDRSIDAVHLCARSLERARRGLYAGLSFRQTRPGLRDRYFRAQGLQWEIDENLRQSIRYRVGNLIDPAFLAGETAFDLILCRNLFIYLGSAGRQRALDNLERLLHPAGLLSMGFAEPLETSSGRFQRTGPSGLFLYRRGVENPAEPAAPVEAPALRVPAPPGPPPSPHLTPLRVAPPAPDLLALARQQADRGELLEAITSCRAFLARKGPSAEAYSLLGVIHTARQEPEEAVRCLERALYLDPGHREALLHLMLLREQQGQLERAARLRRRLERIPSGEEP